MTTSSFHQTSNRKTLVFVDKTIDRVRNEGPVHASNSSSVESIGSTRLQIVNPLGGKSSIGYLDFLAGFLVGFLVGREIPFSLIRYFGEVSKNVSDAESRRSRCLCCGGRTFDDAVLLARWLCSPDLLKRVEMDGPSDCVAGGGPRGKREAVGVKAVTTRLELPPSLPEAPASLSIVVSGVDAAAAVEEAVVAVARVEEDAIVSLSTAAIRDRVVVSSSEVEAASAEVSREFPNTKGQEKTTRTAKR
ncbi:hypothetical protein BDV97DRAFT_369255 [Delphinella strobiligena]|nr:hypothetical protein BDV97DRAFT_369255 [Delphinella strobiligena]